MHLLQISAQSRMVHSWKNFTLTLSLPVSQISIDLGCLYCRQTRRAFNVFKNTLNWLKIDSVDQKLFKIQLTRVWELRSSYDRTWFSGPDKQEILILVWELSRRWNAWHWERQCVFTDGGERVKLPHPQEWYLSMSNNDFRNAEKTATFKHQ
jgi:hypothetical protein